MKTREECLKILNEYTKNESLIKHALAVEACVTAYAKKYGQDIAYWGNCALLHDFDYEMYPTEKEHPYKGAEILRSMGFDEEFVLSIMSHASYTGIARDSLLKKALFACDELAGFIMAVVYVRPSRCIDEVEVKSVKKKMKDKAFARAVSREDIISGAEGLGLSLDEHISFCIEAMKAGKAELGI